MLCFPGLEKTVAGSEESTRPKQKNDSGPVLNFHIGRDAWSNCRVQERRCLMAVHRFTPLPSTLVSLLLLVRQSVAVRAGRTGLHS